MDILVKNLLDAFSVSSREDEIRNIIKEELKEIENQNNIKLEIKEDKLGNLIVKLGEGKEKLMICTHMDSPGLMATFIENSGFIRGTAIGNIKLKTLDSNFVKFKNGTIGRIGISKDKPSKKDLFIDISASNREEAIEKVKEGDIASFIGSYLETESRIVSPNLHSKIGCYILLKAIKEIKKIDKEIYFVFSAQKEVEYRGARAAAFQIEPDECIVLDGIEAGDSIGGNEKIKLENGPAVSIFDKSLVIHHEIKEKIENAAKKINVGFQYSISDEKNEGGFIHKEIGGIKTGMIGIPCRYMNTVGEMISLSDVENTISIIKALL
ncbi:M42 family metallopeptidase [Clostridium ganghwense]|uniref:Peptidase M42 n=1 Tax=Clostridium ganghwense TaxID=312089 RepID=A0ABT4CUM0_9CLOT|nr:peptidase M42 [Clostridium ganghwense]MCY6372727.1 peptidase M42 [Clostridium ganghwense]